MAQLAAEVVGLRLPSARHPGLGRFFQKDTWLWAAIFAASTAWRRRWPSSPPAWFSCSPPFTVGGVAVGAFLFILWFIRVLRRFSRHVRFTQT